MTTVVDLNGHGVDMALISVGAVLRFDSGPAERGRVVRMDLPRLGVVETIESAVLAPGERAIFHGLNVTAIEPAEGTTREAVLYELGRPGVIASPDGCVICGWAERVHFRWYVEPHIKPGVPVTYVRPGDATRLARMKLRREQRLANAAKASEPDPDVHNSNDPGCDACGTCMAHDGCADPDNPHNGPRGDCAECGACGDCVRACAEQRARDNAPYSSEADRG